MYQSIKGVHRFSAALLLPFFILAAALLTRSGPADEWDSPEPAVPRCTVRDLTQTVSIPRTTVYRFTDQLPRGAELELAPGADGELLRTAAATVLNGQEVSRTQAPDRVFRQPIDRVVLLGTGQSAEGPVIGDRYITLPTGEVLTYTGTTTVRATAYTHTDAGCTMLTYTGTRVHVGTVAVDPRFIPYGTRMFIAASDGSWVYGIAQAEDCGGDIKGNRVDLYLPTYEECIAFGRRECTVYFLG